MKILSFMMNDKAINIISIILCFVDNQIWLMYVDGVMVNRVDGVMINVGWWVSFRWDYYDTDYYALLLLWLCYYMIIRLMKLNSSYSVTAVFAAAGYIDYYLSYFHESLLQHHRSIFSILTHKYLAKYLHWRFT